VRIARFNTEVKAMPGSIFSSCLHCLQAPLIAQVDVVPARVKILKIPSALAMTDQD
jgi:hypothetical protein